MDTTGWYNGYSWKERDAKLRAMKRLIASGELPQPTGPCELCGDPDAPVQYHDEDYSKPYLWGSPAQYKLCRSCHIDRLHKRFARPLAWQAFLAHVRRGGYASDLKEPSIKNEVNALRFALESGAVPPPLRPLRIYKQQPGQEWFAALTVRTEDLVSAAARPRP